MLKCNITPSMIDKAQKRSDELGCLNNSFTQGKGNIYGMLGEMIVSNYLNIPLGNTYNYDLTYNDKKIEVKSKHCVSIPRDYYECSIAKTSLFQNTDIYIFTRILKDMTRGWILGWITKKDFMDNSIEHSKGDVDMSNGFVFKSDCRNIPISSLHHMNNLIT